MTFKQKEKNEVNRPKLFIITHLFNSNLDLVISSLLAYKMVKPCKQSDICSRNNIEPLCSTFHHQISKHSAKKESFVIPNSDREIAAVG